MQGKLASTVLRGAGHSNMVSLLDYSVKQGNPDYSLLPFENLDQLPALRWKIMNINKMDKKKHNMMLEKLKKILFE